MLISIPCDIKRHTTLSTYHCESKVSYVSFFGDVHTTTKKDIYVVLGILKQLKMYNKSI